jgi:hypothetical protein
VRGAVGGADEVAHRRPVLPLQHRQSWLT